MNNPSDLILFHTDAGEAWALFVWGEASSGSVNLATYLEAMNSQGGFSEAEALELLETTHGPHAYWIRKATDADEDDGYCYTWCEENDAGALRITGWRFG